MSEGGVLECALKHGGLVARVVLMYSSTTVQYMVVSTAQEVFRTAVKVVSTAVEVVSG